MEKCKKCKKLIVFYLKQRCKHLGFSTFLILMFFEKWFKTFFDLNVTLVQLWCLLPYESSPTETWLTVYRRLDIHFEN